MGKECPPDPRILELGDPAPKQKKYIQAWIDYGSAGKAATALGVNKSLIIHAKRTVEKRAADKGFSPVDDLSKFVPEGRHIAKKTIEVSSAGEINRQWVRVEENYENRLESIRSAVSSIADSLPPLDKIALEAKKLDEMLATLYTITDYHIGAYSFAKETGADWDLDIAQKLIVDAYAEMIALSPPSEVGIFAQMGDFLHWDGILPVTYTSKNILDADTRYPLVVEVAVRVCVRIVMMMLKKHQKVHVVMCEGNHDIIGSVWLQLIMKILFQHNKRVTVDQSFKPFYAYKWGKVFNGWHHGHLVRINKLAAKFYSEPEFRRMMGQCDYIYLHTGHTHQEEKIEEAGAIIERHPSLTQRDAHGARGFDLTQRGAKSITYHKTKGEISRTTVRP